ncbi:nuclear transport factor 2 family protein [Actinokineospora bangkokensis]|uniref:SnoaL-like domain-containing protein n=1 Tax=Actinokineospora bangkokensis TaxID=1193682 RepID=A0A1Q9LJY7_9PSEU|nr:nuclear transport factor 2 family protein [Actinokineospora bangkokensis]OLR92367.1 hypothetical protein BJP25_19960 [Actinokineospora bangkokensis]
MTPRDLLDEALRLLLAKDMAGFSDLWAEDGTMEFPFAPEGYPRLEGRAAVADYVRDYPDLLDIHEFTDLVVHETADPRTIVAEFAARGAVTATGAPYQLRYIAVITAVDGKITSYRDYWSPAAVAGITGSLDDFAAGVRS